MSGLAHEVIGPDVVSVLGPQPDAGTIGQLQPASLGLFGRYLEAFCPPDASYSLGIHRPAGHLQEVGDASVAIAAEAARQGDDGCRKRVFIPEHLGSVALTRAMLAQSLTSPAFRYMQPLTDCLDTSAST